MIPHIEAVLALHEHKTITLGEGKRFRLFDDVKAITTADHVLFRRTKSDEGPPHVYQFLKCRSGYDSAAVLKYSEFFRHYFEICPGSTLSDVKTEEFVPIQLVIATDADLVLFKTLSVESMDKVRR